MVTVEKTQSSIIALIRRHKQTGLLVDAYIDEDGVYTCIVRDYYYGTIKYIGTKKEPKVEVIYHVNK